MNYDKDEKAEIFLRKSLEICRNIYGGDHEETIEELTSFIDFLEDKEDYKQVDLLYNELLKSTQTVHGKEHEQTLRTKQNYAVFLRNYTKELEKALTLLEEVLLVRRKENDLKDLSSVLTALGTTFFKRESFDEAHDALSESIDIRRKLFTKGDETLLNPLISSLNRILEIYVNKGQIQDSKKIQVEIKALSK